MITTDNLRYWIGLSLKGCGGTLGQKEVARQYATENFYEVAKELLDLLEEKPERRKLTEADRYPAGMSECESVGMSGNCPGACGERDDVLAENTKLREVLEKKVLGESLSWWLRMIDECKKDDVIYANVLKEYADDLDAILKEKP